MTLGRLLLSQILFWSLIPSAFAGDKSWNDAGTVGAGVLVSAALLIPTVRDDWEGGGQAAGSIGAAALLSEGLKRLIPEARPDGSDRRGFPSMHTGIAFASAATIQNRYGWKAGVPAQVVACFVGVARVKARKHYWHDVLVGAAIGELSGFLITEKESSRVRIMPWADGSGGGFALAAKF